MTAHTCEWNVCPLSITSEWRPHTSRNGIFLDTSKNLQWLTINPNLACFCVSYIFFLNHELRLQVYVWEASHFTILLNLKFLTLFWLTNNHAMLSLVCHMYFCESRFALTGLSHVCEWFLRMFNFYLLPHKKVVLLSMWYWVCVACHSFMLSAVSMMLHVTVDVY